MEERSSESLLLKESARTDSERDFLTDPLLNLLFQLVDRDAVILVKLLPAIVTTEFGTLQIVRFRYGYRSRAIPATPAFDRFRFGYL